MIAIRDSKMTSQKGGRKCGPLTFYRETVEVHSAGSAVNRS